MQGHLFQYIVVACTYFLGGLTCRVALFFLAWQNQLLFTILFSTFILDAVDADCVEESDELKEGRGELGMGRDEVGVKLDRVGEGGDEVGEEGMKWKQEGLKWE